MQVIHHGFSCKQYYNFISDYHGDKNDLNETINLLSRMIKTGEAMICPRCEVNYFMKFKL